MIVCIFEVAVRLWKDEPSPPLRHL